LEPKTWIPADDERNRTAVTSETVNTAARESPGRGLRKEKKKKKIESKRYSEQKSCLDVNEGSRNLEMEEAWMNHDDD
jgi:hypothetical protein